MPVEIFTKEQFENVLPCDGRGDPLWEPVGFTSGEWFYLVKIDDRVGIMVRSSVGKSGKSAPTGEDSIRAWLVTYRYGGSRWDFYSSEKKYLLTEPLGSKVTRWTTRLPGWGNRLTKVLRTLWKWRKAAGDCVYCNKPKAVFKVKKPGLNKGRLFAKCTGHGEATFTWLTEVKK